jgi:hypothetical protein
MFCPECRAEYRPGSTRCTDCVVDLVAELPEPADPVSLSHVWTGKDQARCVEICKDIGTIGIPYNVEQSRRQILRGLEEHYRISVPKPLSDRARRIVKVGLV